MKGTSGVSVTGAFVKRTWDISKQNPNGGAGLNFVFNWNAGDVNSPMASHGLFHFENNAWVRQTGSSSATANSLTYTGYTGSFFPFAIADIAAALAIDLKSFTVTCDNENNLVKWSTAAPKEITFYVERSSDLRDWESIKVIRKESYSIVGQQGQVLLSGKLVGLQQRLNVTSLKNGVYYLQLKGKGIIETRKIIIKK